MYHLVSDPDALQRVRQELHQVLELSKVGFSSGTDVVLTRQHLDQLLYLGRLGSVPLRELVPTRLVLMTRFPSESSINESLRLSSSSMNIRVAQEDFSLRLDAEHSVGIRKGDVVTLYPRRMHLDPEVYDDPQVDQVLSGQAQVIVFLPLNIFCVPSDFPL